MNVRYVGLHVPTATPHPVGLTDVNVRYVGLHVPTATPHPVGLLDVNVRYVGLHVPTATPHPVGLPRRERTVCGFTCTYSHSTSCRSHWTGTYGMWVYMYLQPLHTLKVSRDVNVRYVGLHVPTATLHPVDLTGRERTVCGFTCTYSHSTPCRSHWT